MVLCDSKLSMRPLCSKLLTTPVDYKFCNMFDEMHAMASRGPIKVLNKYFL